MFDYGHVQAVGGGGEELDIPVHADAIAQVLALRDRLEARITAAVGRLDADEGWSTDGAASLTAWLRSEGRMTSREAARMAATARRLRSLPVLADAWRDGSLSGGQVAAVVANVRDDTVEALARQEAALVPALVDLSVAHTAAALRVWAHRAEALVDPVRPDEPERSVYLSATLGGRHELRGSLDAEGGSVVATALRLAASADVVGEDVRPPATRRADALVDVCRAFLDGQLSLPGGRHRPHLNVVVDLEAIAARAGGRLVDGPELGPRSIERLLCDASVHRVVTAGRSSVLDYGRATRTIPAPLWSALVVRDRSCRFPGCDRPPHWCEGHHIHHWSDGGPTDLDNLVLLCTRHHHRCHDPGWQLKRRPDGEVEVTTPRGRVLASRAPPIVAEPAAA